MSSNMLHEEKNVLVAGGIFNNIFNGFFNRDAGANRRVSSRGFHQCIGLC